MPDDALFEREEAALLAALPRLLEEARHRHPRRPWVLVRGDDVHSYWSTFADAAQAMTLLFGGEPVMIGNIDEGVLPHGWSGFNREVRQPTDG